jgi:hypothetical protein
VSAGYDYSRAILLELFLRMQFPERTQRESALIKDFLSRHIHEYDHYSFSVRVGQGLAPDPTHLSGIQFNSAHSTKKRIDVVAWQGAQPFIFEVKFRANPAAIGQLLTYRQLWMEDNPSEPEPQLACIARYSDPDSMRVFAAAGITLYLYDAPAGDGGDGGGSVPADHAETD